MDDELVSTNSHTGISKTDRVARMIIIEWRTPRAHSAYSPRRLVGHPGHHALCHVGALGRQQACCSFCKCEARSSQNRSVGYQPRAYWSARRVCALTPELWCVWQDQGPKSGQATSFLLQVPGISDASGSPDRGPDPEPLGAQGVRQQRRPVRSGAAGRAGVSKLKCFRCSRATDRLHYCTHGSVRSVQCNSACAPKTNHVGPSEF